MLAAGSLSNLSVIRSSSGYSTRASSSARWIVIVPSASTQADGVARLAAHFYDPGVAAKVAAWVNYICPVVGAQEAMERIDPDLALSPLIFPDTSILNSSYQFTSLPAQDDQRLRRSFASIATA